MLMEYAVKAEAHEGMVLTLREGFPSRTVAEDFPVRLAKWRRVWVERMELEARS
jgi:hypothetical protein